MKAGLSAEQALERLKQGNQRFVSGKVQERYSGAPPELDGLVESQNPIATVLGCSDSRVPTELIFDQGLGDLFVTRVAGNVAAPSQIGSVEYAATVLGTPLIVVLGHTGCGAVKATIEAMHNDNAGLSDNLRAILDRIRPAIDGLMTGVNHGDADELMGPAVRANIHVTIKQMENDSMVIQNLVGSGALKIVGAEYDLATGEVKFFE